MTSEDLDLDRLRKGVTKDLSREHKNLFMRIGAWANANALREHFALSRKLRGVNEEVDANLGEVPFGNVTYISPQAAPSTLSRWLGPILLSALAGAGGYWYATSKANPVPPPPVDAIIEWQEEPGNWQEEPGNPHGERNGPGQADSGSLKQQSFYQSDTVISKGSSEGGR